MDTELKMLLRLLMRKIWFIAITAAVSVSATLLYHQQFAVPEYEAVAKLIVHSASSAENTETYKEIMMTPVILAAAAARHDEWGLSAKQLAARLTVSTSDKSQVISISVKDSSPDQASAIVSGVAETFQQEIPLIMNVDSVKILSDNFAGEPPRDVSPSLSSMLAIALVVSLIASIGFVLLREYFNDKIRTEQDVAQWLDLPVLGSIDRIRRRDMKPVMHEQTKAQALENRKLEKNGKIKAGESINVGINHQA